MITEKYVTDFYVCAAISVLKKKKVKISMTKIVKYSQTYLRQSS